MNKFAVLLRRELWEHRRTFFTLPLVVSVLCAVFLFFGLATMEYGSVKVDGDIQIEIDSINGETMGHQLTLSDTTLKSFFAEKLRQFSDLPESEREKILNGAYLTFSMPLFFVLILVVPTFLLSCLYEERKDRSILFWKSMPVSDLQTVIAKLAAGLVMAPLIYLGFAVILHLLLLIVSVVVGLLYSVPVWDSLVAPANLFDRWFKILVAGMFISAWSLPLLAWVLLVSAAARSVPIAWVIGIPVALIVFERITLGSTVVGNFIARHARPFDSFEQFQGNISGVIAPLWSLEYLVGMVVAMALVTATIYLRGKASEL